MARTRPLLALWEEILVRWASGESFDAMRIDGYAATDLRALVRKRFESNGVKPPDAFMQIRPESGEGRQSKLGSPLARFMDTARVGLRPSLNEARAARERILDLERKVRALAEEALPAAVVVQLAAESSSEPEMASDSSPPSPNR